MKRKTPEKWLALFAFSLAAGMMSLVSCAKSLSPGSPIHKDPPSVFTYTQTFTRTGTPTATQTASTTPTATATASSTSTSTSTSTRTSSSTSTSTSTRTVTPTLTASPTATNTPTVTNTPTITNTPTVTHTRTSTPCVAGGYQGYPYGVNPFSAQVAQRSTAFNGAQIVNVWVYLANPSGRISAAVYNGNGGGAMDVLLAQSAPQSAVTGWNKVPLLSPATVTDPIGLYFLAISKEFAGSGMNDIQGDIPCNCTWVRGTNSNAFDVFPLDDSGWTMDWNSPHALAMFADTCP